MNADQHPGPWRVDEAVRPIRFISDADGNEIAADLSGSPVVRELLRLAPEMEAALRRVEWSGRNDRNASCCPSCRAIAGFGPSNPGDPHKADCSVGAIIAALDAARAAT